MTHDDLNALADRPAFNRTQREELRKIADQLRDDWLETQTEYDNCNAYYIQSVESAPAICEQLRDDYRAMLERARLAIEAENYPRANHYLKAIGELSAEITQ